MDRPVSQSPTALARIARNQQLRIDPTLIRSAIIYQCAGTIERRKQIIEERFDTVSGEEDWIPRYNIAPTQPVPMIRQHPKEPRRMLSLVRWRLIPSWAKDASGAAQMINATSETAATWRILRSPSTHGIQLRALQYQ